MKKLLIVVVGVLTMTACGNKTKGGEAIDSTLVDSLMTDSVVLGVSDLWTVDAVEAQIRLCFEEVNRMAEADGIYINRLDSMFCSKDFLELQDQLYAKVRDRQSCDSRFHQVRVAHGRSGSGRGVAERQTWQQGPSGDESVSGRWCLEDS